MHASTTAHRDLAKIVQSNKYNKKCADCNKSNPTWASTNLGCFMCLECSGIHRAIGVHITKIKSITLDKWHPHEVEFMRSMGNYKHNALWAAFLDAGIGIRPTSSMRERDTFIRLKYERKKWWSQVPLPKNKQPEEDDVPAEQQEQFLTAAQRAKVRRERAAKEAEARKKADQEAAERAREEALEQKKKDDDNAARELQRKKEMEERLAHRAKIKAAEAEARAARKSRRARRRSKGDSAAAGAGGGDLFEGLSSAGTGGGGDSGAGGEADLFAGLSDPLSSVPQDTSDDLLGFPAQTAAPESAEGELAQQSGFSFLAAPPPSEGPPLEPAPSIPSSAASGFSFLNAVPPAANTPPPTMKPPAATKVEDPFAGLNVKDAGLVSNDAPEIMPAEAVPQASIAPTAMAPSHSPAYPPADVAGNAASPGSGNLEERVAAMETTLGGVQSTFQWYVEALNAFHVAKANLVQVEGGLRDAVTSDPQMQERIQYLKEQVQATHGFLEQNKVTL
jgi:hypothetical protein